MRLPIYQFDNKYSGDIDGFTFDFSGWIGDADTFSTAPTATIIPSDTAAINQVIVDGFLVTVWVSGGTAGTTYSIEIDVQTAAGRDCSVRGQFGIDP